MGDEEITNRQEMFILAWSLTVVVVTLIFGLVIFMMGREEMRDKKKLYNFDKAPR